MEIYLTQDLASNRKGRFLQSLLGAQVLPSLWPKSGLLLCADNTLTDKTDAQAVFTWAMQPGCSVLVLPPYGDGKTSFEQLPVALDWQLMALTGNLADEGLVGLVKTEVQQTWLGHDGSADPKHHCQSGWVHTRYYRQHSNSGLFAATTLPIWSISLLDHATELKHWLQWFVQHSGTSAADPTPVSTKPLESLDFSVLLLAYACPGSDAARLEQKAQNCGLFDAQALNVTVRFAELERQGFLSLGVLQEKGLAALQNSHYWAYAGSLVELLKEGDS